MSEENDAKLREGDTSQKFSWGDDRCRGRTKNGDIKREHATNVWDKRQMFWDKELRGKYGTNVGERDKWDMGTN